MINKLVSFGCSWTFGDELMNPNIGDVHCTDPLNDTYRRNHSFSGLIAKHFGWDYRCLAFPGGSLQAMIWNLNWWLDITPEKERAETFVFVGLTDESRNSWYNPYYQNRLDDWGVHRYMHSIWLQGTDNIKDEPYMNEWRQLNKLYYTLSDCDKAREIRYAETVRFFDGVSARYNIPMLQVKMLTQQTKPNVPTLLESDTVLNMLMSQCEPRTNSLFCAGLHPNEQGHQIISEYLIPEVKSVIMSE